MAMTPLCEVRIPTYRRPRLLRRALKSLFAQTCGDWAAIVMDDSPDREGNEVADSFHDSRIIYSPNPGNLGRIKNLDRAFQTTPYLEASYAFVLEDDNYLFPEFIEENIKSLKRHWVPILLRNQEMRIERSGQSVPVKKTTRGNWFSKGIYEPGEIYPHIFFHSGISNGGLFWDTRAITSDLQVGPGIKHQANQEMLRSLQLTDRLYFEPEPLCVFTLFETRDDEVEMSAIEKRLFNRAVQSIYMYVLRAFGKPMADRATKIAENRGFRPVLERRLLDALYLSYDFRCIRKMEFTKILSKSFLRYFLYQDPLKDQYRKNHYRYYSV